MRQDFNVGGLVYFAPWADSFVDARGEPMPEHGWRLLLAAP